MTDQDLWFEPVSLLSRCSLNEGLLWVWAARVPVSSIYREENVFESLQDWECERLKIPPVPRGVGRGAQYRTEERLRGRNYGKMTKDAREYHVLEGMEEAEAVRQWLPLLTAAMELRATELFLTLRRGQIEALGKLLPAGVEIIDFLEDHNSYSRSKFDDLYQPAETLTHRRHCPCRARRQYPIGSVYVFAMDVPVGRRQDESGSASFGIS